MPRYRSSAITTNVKMLTLILKCWKWKHNLTIACLSERGGSQEYRLVVRLCNILAQVTRYVKHLLITRSFQKNSKMNFEEDNVKQFSNFRSGKRLSFQYEKGPLWSVPYQKEKESKMCINALATTILFLPPPSQEMSLVQVLHKTFLKGLLPQNKSVTK